MRSYIAQTVETARVGLFLVISLSAISMAILLGLVAVTANIVLISITTAVLLSFFLLVKPTLNIWLVLILGLLVAGVLPIWVDFFASKAVWGISVLGFVLMISAVFGAAIRPGATQSTPGFVWAALVFMLYAVLVTLIQLHSVWELLTGFKRYFQVFGLIFALSWLVISKKEIDRWRAFFLFVAIVQLPFAVYELVKLVPLRESLGIPYLVPIDVVAGTFGANLYTGGANAEMATFLIIVLAFLLARRQEKLIHSGRLFLLAPLILAPLFLGETKIVVILLPLMFFTLYRRELLARPHYAVIGLAVGAVLTAAAGMSYLSIKNTTLNEEVRDVLSYNVYERGHGGYQLNRTRVLSFWAARQSAADPVALLLGNGLGSSHDATGGHIAARYLNYGIGLTAASTLLWDLGVIGFALFFGILILAWRTAGRLRREAKEQWIRADVSAIQAVLPLFGVYVFYRLALLETLSFQIVFSMLLGYLAWLNRRHAQRA